MGKTYRRMAIGYYRVPRGNLRARINGARHKAIPPSGWDDISAGKEATSIFSKVAERLKEKGLTEEQATRRLCHRFPRLSYREAEEVIGYEYREWSWLDRREPPLNKPPTKKGDKNETRDDDDCRITGVREDNDQQGVDREEVPSPQQGQRGRENFRPITKTRRGSQSR